jgi:hypothetical protein
LPKHLRPELKPRHGGAERQSSKQGNHLHWLHPSQSGSRLVGRLHNVQSITVDEESVIANAIEPSTAQQAATSEPAAPTVAAEPAEPR